MPHSGYAEGILNAMLTGQRQNRAAGLRFADEIDVEPYGIVKAVDMASSKPSTERKNISTDSDKLGSERHRAPTAFMRDGGPSWNPPPPASEHPPPELKEDGHGIPIRSTFERDADKKAALS